MMIDPLGRDITYLRLSVTDRCDLRCLYCMDETPEFLPKPDVLSLEELERLARVFIGLGVRKLRLTGGEPLVRRGVMGLIARLGAQLAAGGLDELTLTTNGTRLAACAAALAAAGVQRLNVSLDTLQPEVFRRITRTAALPQVLAGIAAARAAGLRVKINTVVMAGINEDEIETLVEWCGSEGFDLTLIESMPLGGFPLATLGPALPLAAVRARLARRWTLRPLPYRSGGPARYVQVEQTGTRLGFITPLSDNFCAGCNRVRLTCTGRLVLCLGHEDGLELRPLLRAGADDAALRAAILAALRAKPAAHEFAAAETGQAAPPARGMHITGG
jgi:cyclic pyranopterin phosphate synthase